MAKKNKAAQMLGRKGGRQRAKNMSADERSESARKAALAKHAKEREIGEPAPRPQSLTSAANGVRTLREVFDMLGLAGTDIASGTITPKQGNALSRACGKLLKERGHKLASGTGFFILWDFQIDSVPANFLESRPQIEGEKQ